MGNIVAAYEVLSGKQWTETEGWQFMIALKLGRIKTKFKEDDVYDLINYVALWMESMTEQNKSPEFLKADATTDDAAAMQDGIIQITVIGNDILKIYAVYDLNNPTVPVPDMIRKITGGLLQAKGLTEVSLAEFAKATEQTIEQIIKDTLEERAQLEDPDLTKPLLSLLPVEELDTVEVWKKDVTKAVNTNPHFKNVMKIINSAIVSRRELAVPEIEILTESLEKSYADSDCQCMGVRQSAITILESAVNMGKLFQNPTAQSRDEFNAKLGEALYELYALLPYVGEHAIPKVH